MRKLALLASVGLVMVGSMSSAEAQWRRYGWGGGGYYGYHHGGNYGGALAAGLIGGAILGGLIASATPAYSYGYGYPAYSYGYPAYGYPAYGYGYPAPVYRRTVVCPRVYRPYYPRTVGYYRGPYRYGGY